MKKFILIIIFIQNIAFGQNWSLFPIIDTLTYKNSSNEYISSTIQVKPNQSKPNSFNISKSVYFCDTCFGNNFRIYKLQSDFLYNHYSIDPGNKVILYNNENDSAIIYTNKEVGYNWNFKGNVSAVVLSIEEGSIFNNADSIKTILFSSGDTIKLSKNHGVYSFKHPTLGYVKLVGNHSKNLGTKLFDVNTQKKVGVGDYINFELYRFSGDYGFPCTYNELTLFKIKSIEKTAWQTIYHGVSFRANSGYIFCSPPKYVSGSSVNFYAQLQLDTLIYSRLPNSLLNYGYISSMFDTFSFNILSYNLVDNKIRINAIPNDDSTLFKKTILRKIGAEIYQQIKFDFFDAWIETVIPYLSFSYRDFEHEEYNVLSGYSIDGQLYGNIDTSLILGIKNKAHDYFKIAPNPSNGKFNIFISNQKSENKSVQILNQLGEIVYMQENIMNNNINIDAESLSSGIYMLKLIEGGYELYNRIVIFKNTSQ